MYSLFAMRLTLTPWPDLDSIRACTRAMHGRSGCLFSFFLSKSTRPMMDFSVMSVRLRTRCFPRVDGTVNRAYFFFFFFFESPINGIIIVKAESLVHSDEHPISRLFGGLFFSGGGVSLVHALSEECLASFVVRPRRASVQSGYSLATPASTTCCGPTLADCDGRLSLRPDFSLDFVDAESFCHARALW